MTNRVGELFAGVGLLPRALGLMLRRPKLFVLGAIPALITSIVFLAVIIALATQITDLSSWLTPFTNAWSPGLAAAVRAVVGAMVIAGAILVMVISFSSLTLALGAPLYDKIAESVEDQLGHAPDPVADPASRAVVRSVRQAVALIVVSILVTIVLFFAGFIPVVGQVVVPVVSAIFGGWMLCIELLGAAFMRRGRFSIRERRAVMRTNRARVLGLSIPCFLMLAVPFLAIVVFPVATAAGTILARDLLTARKSVAP